MPKFWITNEIRIIEQAPRLAQPNLGNGEIPYLYELIREKLTQDAIDKIKYFWVGIERLDQTHFFYAGRPGGVSAMVRQRDTNTLFHFHV